jgi:hypothetical protein
VSDLTIVYGRLGGVGWHPVTALAELAAELLEARLVTVPADNLMRHAARLASGLPRHRGRGTCLVIASQPRQLFSLLQPPYLLRGYAQVAGWVIDSFWHERIPRGTRIRSHYDRLFVTDPDDLEPWSDATRLPVSCLPWGADVLRLGSDQPDRPVDLQRVGRQPAAWDDDLATDQLMRGLGLTFRSRPPMSETAGENQALLARTFSNAKFTLSFSNVVSPAGYTHPTREYLTARWTDALAAGAVVAGIRPKSAATRSLLWPEATLELPSAAPTPEALQQLRKAVELWTPERARHNHRIARQNLDWRWRLQELAHTLNVQAPRLQAEITLLRGEDAGSRQ